MLPPSLCSLLSLLCHRDRDDYSDTDTGVDVNPEYGQSTDYSDSVFVDKNTDYYGGGD